MKEGIAATHVRATLPTRPAGMVAFQDGARAGKEEVVDEKSNREIAEGAFREWTVVRWHWPILVAWGPDPRRPPQAPLRLL
jgi:hypothetical protein